MEYLLPDVALRDRGTSESGRGRDISGSGKGAGSLEIGRHKGWEWPVFELGIHGG